MIDGKKVIKAIENNLAENYEQRGCADCPYNDDCHGCATAWKADALVLLKEQEAVEPINSYGTFRCGNCRNIVGYNDGHGRGYQNNFCSKCGRPVLWEGR